MQEHHEGFDWVHHIPALEGVESHVVMATFVAVMLIVTGGIAALLVKKSKNPVVPDSVLSFKNFFEILAEKLFGFCESILGQHDAEKFFPVISSLFLFIFASNLFGLIPGFVPPTDNINTTLALGLFVYLYYNFQGLKENGLAYLKHFMGPVLFLAPLMIFLELVSHLARPLSLALRLRGNMMGDHAVLGVFLSITPYVIPVIFYVLGLFVAFVQAYVFCLLTMVYISLSTAHDH
jgi:F-type H+-transporting ATPase subunit a